MFRGSCRQIDISLVTSIFPISKKTHHLDLDNLPLSYTPLILTIIIFPQTQEDGECITFKFGHEEACDRFILCMRILIDQHRDCFNFATRRKDQKLLTSEGRRGQKKGANGEKSRERNVTQVAGDGDGGNCGNET